MLLKLILIVLCTLWMSGCTHLNSTQSAPAMLSAWQPLSFTSDHFDIVGWKKPGEASNHILRVYIEGDGFAWATPGQPSADPTPHHPLAMELAYIDTAKQIVYLARPCQFSARLATACDENRWWTSERYSRVVIERYHQILDTLKAGAVQPSIELIGYSGGAAIATILAAERKDVISLRTVAGNLDSEYVNQIHHASPMPASLNPVAFANRLTIPQLHFVGEQDSVITPEVAQRFVSHTATGCAQIKTVKYANHWQGWQTAWPELLQSTLPRCHLR